MTSNKRDQTRWILGTALTLFLLALTTRVLFWQATPDAANAYTAYYKGDAPYWTAYARSIQDAVPFELGLPLRPPGVPYLIAGIWSGKDSDFFTLRLVWCLLGAALAPLVFVSTRQFSGSGSALVAGLVTASSAGLMIVSTSLNNETPYLFLVISVLALWEKVRQRQNLLYLFLWGALNGLACLIRAEHILFFALISVYLFWVWTRSRKPVGDWKRSLGGIALIWVFFGIVLTPWHLKAWSDIEKFNKEPLATNPATEQFLERVESSFAHLEWRGGAIEKRRELPAFSRRNASNFVAATIVVRGGLEVRTEDFNILEEAFGYLPEPIDEHPFVVVYGGLNFLLANNRNATGGFSLAPLEEPPPLKGGASRYPQPLIAGLPLQQLTLTYPPHLRALNHGYALGLKWIIQNPTHFLGLTWKKLRFFWEGASLGFTGYNLPLGLSGTRRPVDLVVPDRSWGTGLWRTFLAGLVVLGLFLGVRNEGLLPWLIFLSTKVLVTLAFFGYAREGVTVIPVLAILVGLAVGSWLPDLERLETIPKKNLRNWLLAALLIVSVLVGLEIARWAGGPVVRVDSKTFGVQDPFSVVDYQERRVEME